jgi:molecular chaperone DnaJ
MFSISQPCSRCGGRGTIIEEPCPTCSGNGATRSVKRYRVNIPAGVHDGSRIRLPGKGEPSQNGGPAGDLYVITRVTPSPVFKQKGEHLEVEVPITVVEALRGGEIEVPTLTGSKRLRVPPGTHHGTVQRLRGEGPPRLSGEGHSDIHYRFVIDLPDELDETQKKAVEALAKTIDGDPRKKLFTHAGGGTHAPTGEGAGK